ncbi:hypothetical protein dsx2_3073 [Desulfovibrio sp. X2]|uniref:hypothetical protein n=1 Tax=Desulfovibrio sp. X2 TaxID=941449 RepID=UPI0003589D47|nr:hypothetical protein [Desulfovibrio sp. X2]EPR41723.1 hypothetical protein dsx2_3073 [Desulfovibrio sp. X2]
MNSNDRPIRLGSHWSAVGVPAGSKEEFKNFICHILDKVHSTRMVNESCKDYIYNSSKYLEICCVIDSASKFSSAVPSLRFDAFHGKKMHMKLERINEWDGGYEANLACTFYGASVCFFDTAYRYNKHKYVVGMEYDFLIGAIAYKVEKSKQELKFKDDHGRQINMGKGFAAFLPFRKDVKDDPEYTILGPVLAYEPSEEGQSAFNRFQVVACRPPIPETDESAELTLDVFALDKALADERPEKEDSLFAIAWLQGKLADV